MKILGLFLVSLLSLTSLAETEPTEILTDVYDFKMVLKVPRVYDNMTSLGYRRYQTQTVTGYLNITYFDNDRPAITITGLTNRTHRLSNGKNVTYDCVVDEYQLTTRVNLIGSNKTNIFKTPSVCFYLCADPNYNVGENDEDNSLNVTLAGSGTCKKINGAAVIATLSGYVAGTLGCGCKAYGHTSPTRVAGPCGATCDVDDVAVVYGQWKAKLNRKKSCR